MNKTPVQTLAESITRKFGLYECRQCADALEAAFRRIGVSGSYLTLQALGVRPFIVMKNSSFVMPWGGLPQSTITENSFHYGIRIGNAVFDNIHRSGIDFADWQASFDCAGGRFGLTSTKF